MKKTLFFLIAAYLLSAICAYATHEHKDRSDKGSRGAGKADVSGTPSGVESGSGSAKPKTAEGMDDFEKDIRKEEDTFDKDFEEKKSSR